MPRITLAARFLESELDPFRTSQHLDGFLQPLSLSASFVMSGAMCRSLNSVYFEPRRMPYLALLPSFSGVLGDTTRCIFARLMSLVSLVFPHCPTEFRTCGTRQNLLDAERYMLCPSTSGVSFLYCSRRCGGATKAATALPLSWILPTRSFDFSVLPANFGDRIGCSFL